MQRWTFPGKQHARAALAGTWQRAPALPAHTSDPHRILTGHLSMAPMEVKERRRKTKLDCSKQAKCLRAAQRSHLPEGSTARCHSHCMPQKENCLWEKKLFSVFLLFLLLDMSFFLTKPKT